MYGKVGYIIKNNHCFFVTIRGVEYYRIMNLTGVDFKPSKGGSAMVKRKQRAEVN